MSRVRGIAAFLKARRRYWLVPLLVMILFYGALFVLTQGTAVTPFVYTRF